MRLKVALEPAAISHVERQNEPAAAPESPGVRPEVFLPAVEQVEKRQQRLGHSAAKRLPVHHRDIFVKEVRRAPCRRIVAVPDALEVCGARTAEARGREEKIAPEVSHLLDEPRIRCIFIGVEQETFVRLARRIRRAEGERRRAEALRELRRVAGEKRVERATFAELREGRLEVGERDRTVPDIDEKHELVRRFDAERRNLPLRPLDFRDFAVSRENARHAAEGEPVRRLHGGKNRPCARLGGEVVPAAVVREVYEVVARQRHLDRERPAVATDAHYKRTTSAVRAADERRALPISAVVGPAHSADSVRHVEFARVIAEDAVGPAAEAQVERREELACRALVAGRLQRVGIEPVRLGEASLGEKRAHLWEKAREIGHLAAARPVVERFVVERDALVRSAAVDKRPEATVAERRRLAPVARGKRLDKNLVAARLGELVRQHQENRRRPRIGRVAQRLA